MSQPSTHSKPTALRALAFALLVFVAVDIAAFRSRLCAFVAKPDSNAGWMVRRTQLATTPTVPEHGASALLLGDSRMGEGADERLLGERLADRRVVAMHAAVPGSTPRVRPTLFSHVPAPRSGFDVVVVGLASSDDDGEREILAQRELDLAFLCGTFRTPAGRPGGTELATVQRMHALSRLLAVLPAAFLLSSPAMAQATRTVGAGQQFATIQAAIDAANPGDTVAVHAGSYATFTLTKSLTVRAEPVGAVVDVNDPVFQVPAGGHARIAGLRCHRSTSCYLAGLVSFEQCEFLGVTPYPNVLVQDGSATFWRCRVADGIGGIRAIRAHVSIVQTDITCAAAGFYLATMCALRLDDGHAHIASSTLVAGDGFDQAGSWPGILALGSSLLDVVDSSVTGGDSIGPTANVVGAPAIRIGVGSVGRHWRCALTPGTTAVGAGPAADSIATPLLGCTLREAALTPGSTMTADFLAEPAAPVLVVAAFALATPAATPFVEQLHWGFTPPAGQVLALSLADSQGQATHALGIPASPIFLGVGVWWTGAELTQAASIVLSPPVGGVIR